MIKVLLEGLEFCKDNYVFDKYINIAIGRNKLAQTFKEGGIQRNIKDYEGVRS